MKNSTNAFSKMWHFVAVVMLSAGLIAQADNLFVANFTDRNIQRFDALGNATLFANVASGAGNYPYALAFDPLGNLYAACVDTDVIFKFDSAGNRTLFAHTARNPVSLAFDHNGTLFAGFQGMNTSYTIYKFDAQGNGTLFANAGLQLPTGLAFDSAGQLYVANHYNNTILRFDLQGHAVTFANAGLGPWGIAIDGNDNLYVSNSGDNTIDKFDPQGNRTLFASSGLNLPSYLTFDSAGNLFVSNHDSIAKFTPQGVGSLFFSTRFWQPLGIVTQPVPEPGYLSLIGVCAGAHWFLRRRKNKGRKRPN